MAASYGSFAAWEMNDVRYDFQPSSMIGVKEQHLNTNGLRGTTFHSVERNLPSLNIVDGQISLIPTPTEMTTILPIVLGTAVAGTTYALAETVTGYTHVVDRVIKVHTYANVKVDSARFHSEQGGAMGVDLNLVGTTETEGAAGSFTSTSIDVATKPWNFHMLTLSVDSTSVLAKAFEFSVERNIDRDRFFNSQSLSTGTNAVDCHIPMRIMLPYGDYPAIYTSSLLNTGVQVVATYTNGVYILTHTFVKVAFRKMAPELNSRGEIMLPLVGEAFKSSTTLPLVTTLAIS